MSLPSDALLASEAAALLGVHKTTIHRWVEAGYLAGWRVGQRGRKPRLVVSRADVLAQVEPVITERQPRGAVSRRTQAVLRRLGVKV